MLAGTGTGGGGGAGAGAGGGGGLPKTKMQHLHQIGQRCKQRKNDVWATPPELAKKHIDWVAEQVGAVDREVWLEPFRFSGIYFNQFPPNVTAEWCEILDGRDFFDFNGRWPCIGLVVSRVECNRRSRRWDCHEPSLLHYGDCEEGQRWKVLARNDE